MNTLSFAWPWVFLLVPLPFFITPKDNEPDTTSAIALPPRLRDALETVAANHSSHTTMITRALAWLCWFLLLIALAQPSIPSTAVAQPMSGRAISLVIDLSDSMAKQDFELDNTVSDRLSVVKRVAGQFIEQRSGDRLALVLFGEEAFIASPLSFDVLAVKSNLNSAGIGMAGRSTAIGDGLGLAIKTLRSDPAAHKAIVLLSDGTNNAGSVEPESAAKLANSLGIRVYTIALGSDKKASGLDTAPSADLDENTLKAIAEQANGVFFRASTSADLLAIYTHINTLETAETQAPEVILQRDIRNGFLMCLLCLLCLWEVAQRIQHKRVQANRV